MPLPLTHCLAIIPFITPWLFYAGAAAMSIPIIIHLLNKRRFKVVPWAAMSFLFAAMRRNARRLRFQRWLLLLLRCLALLLLAAAIARFTIYNKVFGGLLGQNQGVTVVVWDVSYPMGYHPPGQPSSFAESKKLLTGFINSLPGGERIAVVPAALDAAPLAPRPTRDHAMVARLVRQQKLTELAPDLAGGIDHAAASLKRLAGHGGARRVFVLTNDATAQLLGTAVGGGTGGPVAASLRQAVGQLKQMHAAISWADLGWRQQGNMGLTNLSVARHVVLVRQPLTLRITVTNGSPVTQVQVPVSIQVDGQAPQKQFMHRIAPGRTGTLLVSLPQPLRTPGVHVVTASIPHDLVPVDDTRRLVLQAVKRIPVLLVDGAMGGGREQLASTAWLRAALAPVKANSLFAPRVISPFQFGDLNLKRYRAIVLSNTVAPGAAMAAALRKFVSQGGLLMVIPGSHTASSAMNHALGLMPKGLLPALMGPPAQAPARAAGMATAPLTKKPGAPATLGFSTAGNVNPVTAPFAAAQRGGRRVGLSRVHTLRYIPLKPVSGVAQTLVSFSNGRPAVVLGRYGRGAVVVWATTADTSWTDFAARPSFLPFLYQLFFYALPRNGAALTVHVGQRVMLPPTIAPPGVWAGPRQRRLRLFDAVAHQRSVLTSAPVMKTGLYRPATGAARLALAVNADPSGADLRYVPRTRVAALLGIRRGQIRRHPKALAFAATKTSGADGSNLGRDLLLAALLALALEAIVARFFSAYR